MHKITNTYSSWRVSIHTEKKIPHTVSRLELNTHLLPLVTTDAHTEQKSTPSTVTRSDNSSVTHSGVKHACIKPQKLTKI